ncbi:MAG: nitric oxide reductase D protein [Pseudomonadota bacterium]
MAAIPEFWEPEETVGKLWHGWASRLGAGTHHAGAAVRLEEIAPRLAVLFRALGGHGSVSIRPAVAETAEHRRSITRRLGTGEERLPVASFDGKTLRLPDEIAAFPAPEANAALYVWLAALAAHASSNPAPEPDPLRADVRSIAAARAATAATLADCPGLADLHAGLAEAHLAGRRAAPGSATETAVEAAIRAVLTDSSPEEGLANDLLAAAECGDLGTLAAPRGYRPHLPVPLWLGVPDSARSYGRDPSDEPVAGAREAETEARTRRARQRRSDRAERRDSLILHKFEAILSFAQFLNLNRRVDDDDPEGARKALDDTEELALSQISKAPRTRFKLDLDLAPEDVDRERLSGVHLYPEWDARSAAYLTDHVRVLESPAEPAAAGLSVGQAGRRRIARVKRRFEVLRPRRILLPGQPDGDELDLDAALRSRADLAASGMGTTCVWRASRCEARDLAVTILLDVSRSTESAVGQRTVIEIAREALSALAWGISACGDDSAILAFSSLRRDRVFMHRVKGFAEPMSGVVDARIAGLTPGFYTRLGAAMRHASAGLSRSARSRRLLLVLTDGKPNDLDHYEGRHGLEDSHKAVREARRGGQAVHGLTIDHTARTAFARIFGRGGFTLIPNPERLTDALPAIYRQVVGS